METVERHYKIMVGLREASEITGLSYSCVRRLCLNNEIPFVKSGSKYFVNTKALLDYCNHGRTA